MALFIVVEQFDCVLLRRNYLSIDFTNRLAAPWIGSTTKQDTDCRFIARYVIDHEGIVRAADVNADYTIRSEPSDTLAALKTLTA